MNIKKIKLGNTDLKKENIELKRKLLIAKLWMQREVKSQIKKISKNKLSNFTCKKKNDFFADNIDEIITKKVLDFFWEIMLLNIPSSVIDNIISAEISYFNLRKNPHADWLGIITSYHKALDTLIENFITKWFRKFSIKEWQIQLRKNDLLEKSLNSVVNKWYILSIWRLYHLLKLIKKGDELYDYGKCFKKYIKKNLSISEILLKESNYKIFANVIESEILGKKRHIWKINFVETREARKLLIWNFKDENCLIYRFIEMWKVDY
jgi:hypothetical protein